MSAGAAQERRDLKDFKSNQNTYIKVFNLILDSYIRVRNAFLEMDELWLYLVQYSYSETQEYTQAGSTQQCLFE